MLGITEPKTRLFGHPCAVLVQGEDPVAPVAAEQPLLVPKVHNVTKVTLVILSQTGLNTRSLGDNNSLNNFPLILMGVLINFDQKLPTFANLKKILPLL